MEVILTLKPGGDSKKVAEWFKHRGVAVTAMRAGLLLTGQESDFEKLLGRHDPAFPVPQDLAADVSSIIWRPPPKLT